MVVADIITLINYQPVNLASILTKAGLKSAVLAPCIIDFNLFCDA